MSNKTNSDLVTVLMSVYNTDIKLLDRAVMSILNQTYENIEFIIVDDGAGEGFQNYISEIQDPRIVVLRNDSNIGLAASLNRGLKIARGRFIARMDADDYSCPDRISEQVRYMHEHESVDVLAGISLDIRDGRFTGDIGGAYYKFDSETFKIELSLGPKTFPHPTVMFRADFLNKYGLKYDEEFKRSQDYDMWAKCSMYGKLDSLQKVVLYYNTDDKKSDGLSEGQVYYSNLTKIKCLHRLVENATEREEELYIRLKDTKMTGSVRENVCLVRELVNCNRALKLYNPHKYKRVLYFWWGKKMLYRENREHLSGFLKYPLFVINAAASLAEGLPGYLRRIIYLKLAERRIRGTSI